MSKLPMDGYDLHYTVYRLINKNQPTLLFIHTIGFDSTEWDYLLPNINPSFNLVTYDFYGHGKTTAPDDDLTFEKLELEIIALIKKLGIGKVHLVGSSFGGNLGFFIAKRHPELAASLTLMSTAFYIPRNSYSAEYETKVQLTDIDQELLSQKIVMDSIYPVTPEKSKLIKKAFRHISGKLYKKGMTIMMDAYSSENYNMMDELKQLNVPALILHGEFDPVFPAHLCIVYSTYISNSRWFIIPEASNLIALDQPKIAAKFLNDFITSEKVPVPVTRSHQKMIDEFKTIIEKGYQYKPIYRHFLKMEIMGDIRISWNGNPVDGKWNQRYAKELLLFIILNHGAVKRDMIIDAFMPDLPVTQARNHLRVQLSHLNKIFHKSPDPTVHDVLMISRDTIALNAELQCDITDYINKLDQQLQKKEPLDERAQQFIHLMKVYNPSSLSSFRGEWVIDLIDEIENKLVQVMERLLKELEQENNSLAVREILQSGKTIEPYDGYCEEKLQELERSL